MFRVFHLEAFKHEMKFICNFRWQKNTSVFFWRRWDTERLIIIRNDRGVGKGVSKGKTKATTVGIGSHMFQITLMLLLHVNASYLNKTIIMIKLIKMFYPFLKIISELDLTNVHVLFVMKRLLGSCSIIHSTQRLKRFIFFIWAVKWTWWRNLVIFIWKSNGDVLIPSLNEVSNFRLPQR